MEITKKERNGSTFSFSEIGNTCIKIGISYRVYLQGKIYQIYLFIGSLIFSQKLAILNIFLPKSHVSNFGNNDG